MPQDFTKRFAIIVRRDLEPWQIMNTVSHIAAKLGRDAESFDTGASFVTRDAVEIPRNSQYPVIVFGTEASASIRAMLSEARSLGLPHLAFVREMIDFTDDDQLARALSQKSEAALEYLGVGVFGDNDQLKKLTKKFSLWK